MSKYGFACEPDPPPTIEDAAQHTLLLWRYGMDTLRKNMIRDDHHELWRALEMWADAYDREQEASNE